MLPSLPIKGKESVKKSHHFIQPDYTQATYSKSSAELDRFLMAASVTLFGSAPGDKQPELQPAKQQRQPYRCDARITLVPPPSALPSVVAAALQDFVDKNTHALAHTHTHKAHAHARQIPDRCRGYRCCCFL
jgi:hypothetical protein